MDISVIVPIYRGRKYISRIQRMISENIEYAQKSGLSLQCELIFVNDYPNEQLTICNDENSRYIIKLIENVQNIGIQKTRVNGLSQSSGEFIIFLDQDDEIFENCFYSQYMAIGNNDIVIGNGYKARKGKYIKLYKSKRKQKIANKELFFLKAANQIVSPGHCLIRKSAIPSAWCNYYLVENGGDDMFLWLLMFEEKRAFCINPEMVYKHIDTGINLSNDLNKMIQSAENLIRVSRMYKLIDEKKIRIYERRVLFANEMQKKSVWARLFTCLKNLDICIVKLYAFYK